MNYIYFDTDDASDKFALVISTFFPGNSLNVCNSTESCLAKINIFANQFLEWIFRELSDHY